MVIEFDSRPSTCTVLCVPCLRTLTICMHTGAHVDHCMQMFQVRLGTQFSILSIQHVHSEIKDSVCEHAHTHHMFSSSQYGGCENVHILLILLLTALSISFCRVLLQRGWKHSLFGIQRRIWCFVSTNGA